MAALAGAGAIHDWIARAGVIGIIDVVKNYAYFRRQFAMALERNRHGRSRMPWC